MTAAGRDRPMNADSARDELKPEEGVSDEALKKAEKFVEEEEGAVNRLSGWVWYFVIGVALAMTLFHLYAAYDVVPAQFLRPIHVGFALFLIYLLFPMARRFRNRIHVWDVIDRKTTRRHSSHSFAYHMPS